MSFGILIEMAANVAKLRKDMHDATEVVEKTAKQMEGIFEGAKHALELIGVGFTLEKVVEEFKQTFEAAHELEIQSKNLGGILPENLYAIQLSAKAAGVDTAELSTAMMRFTRNMSDTARGVGQAKNVFDAMGVSVIDSTGHLRKTDEVLAAVADRFKMYSDSAEKSAIAIQLFGRAGAQLVSFLSQGSEGLQKFGTVSEHTIEEMAHLQGEINKLSAEWDKLKMSIGGAVAEFINHAIDGTMAREVTRWVAEFRSAVAESAIKSGKNVFGIPYDPDTVAMFKRDLNESKQKLGELDAQAETAAETLRILHSAEGREMAGQVAAPIALNQEQISFLKKYEEEAQQIALTERELVELAADRLKITGKNREELMANVDAIIAYKDVNKQAKLDEEARAEANRKLTAEFQKQTQFSEKLSAFDTGLDALRLQTSLLGKSADEQEQINAAFGVYRQYLGALKTAGDDQAMIVQAQVAYDKALQDTNEELKKQQDIRNSPQFQLQQSMKSWADDIMNFGKQMATTWQNIFEGMGDLVANFVRTGKADIRSFVLDVIAQMTKLAFERLVIQALGGTALGGFLGIGAGAAGGGVTSGLSSRMASGGPAQSGNMYLVGEQGPELFVPSTNGRVVPNNQIGGGAISVNYNGPMITGAGVSRAEMLSALEQNSRATIARIQDMIQRRQLVLR